MVRIVHENKIADAGIRKICERAKDGGLEQSPLASLPPQEVLVIVNAVSFEGTVIANTVLFEVTPIFGAASEATRPLNHASPHL